MDSILPHIIDLKKRISLLLSKYLDVNRLNESLKTEKISLIKKNQDLENEIKELKKRVEVVDLIKGIGLKESDSMDVAKTRVNNLIREIDKCISLLND